MKIHLQRLDLGLRAAVMAGTASIWERIGLLSRGTFLKLKLPYKSLSFRVGTRRGIHHHP
jgi:hypothetical protein